MTRRLAKEYGGDTCWKATRVQERIRQRGIELVSYRHLRR
ncbi:hypothetical protein BH11GEM1_BH11GEM1_04540 [soil metagenome]